ncbi:shikimate dehydrogenase [Fulvivirgaceae bacterium BMA10]|uniref:Shikimate dehydrogenase (NADP(+)) n=1 Tax=Splendidivirga corallicola TaxID=3051826 RepID=A0ABT8KNC6_9BACT|nr:shikimate dehydrogenase [Fulvivirgaceae bacterium BMA10]
MSNYKSELVGVLGFPVAENPTIVMQEAAFKDLGLNWRYLTVEVRPEQLAQAIRGVRAFNMQGINLTIPHKIAVMEHLDDIAPDAALIGAVNTVRREGDKLIGENTDGKGFIESLKEASVDPVGKTAVILGAGGAARAIAVEMALAGAKNLIVVNRSQERGMELVDLMNSKTNAKAEFISWNGAYRIPGETDILVNATSIGLYPDTTSLPDIDYEGLSASTLVCDVIPNPPETIFLKEARKRGCKTLNGLGMLVYQGTIGFKMWTGTEASPDVMKEALARAFNV